MIPIVELIYEDNCPNVNAAREALSAAFRSVGVAPNWREWNRKESGCPSHALGFGSPTVLVNGNDVAGASPGEGFDCCRIYPDGSATFGGAPSVEMIEAALTSAAGLLRSELLPEGREP